MFYNLPIDPTPNKQQQEETNNYQGPRPPSQTLCVNNWVLVIQVKTNNIFLVQGGGVVTIGENTNKLVLK